MRYAHREKAFSTSKTAMATPKGDEIEGQVAAFMGELERATLNFAALATNQPGSKYREASAKIHECSVDEAWSALWEKGEAEEDVGAGEDEERKKEEGE